MNRNVKILSGRLNSPSLKNVGWIEDTQLIFYFVKHLSVFFSRPLLPPCQIFRQMYGKLETLIERVLAMHATSFKRFHFIGDRHL